jgi:hypothetical protein
MGLVSVFSTFSPGEAQLVRSRLEAAGFSATVSHELSALSTEGYSMSTGGIQVEVPPEQAEEARALIASRGEAPQGTESAGPSDE